MAFNATGDFLCVCTHTHLVIFSTASLVGGSPEPFISLEMDQPVIDVSWSVRREMLEVATLLEDRTFRVYEVNHQKRRLQCTQAFTQVPVSAFTSTYDGWVVGLPDGGMIVFNELRFSDLRIIEPHQPPSDVTTAGDSNGQAFGIHSLQFIAPDVVLVGMFQYAAGEEDGAKDPNKINIAAYNLKQNVSRIAELLCASASVFVGVDALTCDVGVVFALVTRRGWIMVMCFAMRIVVTRMRVISSTKDVIGSSRRILKNCQLRTQQISAVSGIHL
jgi:hypothetical protein